MIELKIFDNVESFTPEEWDNEYTKLDVNNDGAIEYGEMCRYAVKFMKIKPEDFFDGDLELAEDLDGDEWIIDPLLTESVTAAVHKHEAEEALKVSKCV